MTDWKAWAVPLVAGLLTAGGLWMAVPDEAADSSASDHGATDGHSTSTTGPPPVRTLNVPFPTSWGPPGGETTHLLLAPQGREAMFRAFNATSPGPVQPFGTFSWQSDVVAFYTQANVFTGCQEQSDGYTICSDPVWVFGPWPLPRTEALPDNHTGPRLLHDGYNATRVTAYVFDEAGLLLASNAQASDLLKYRLHGDFTRLPTVAWYLGANSTAPNGTVALPGFAKPLLDRVLPQLDGLPEGGVATARSNAYVNLFGTLFVTVRIDALVLAP